MSVLGSIPRLCLLSNNGQSVFGRCSSLHFFIFSYTKSRRDRDLFIKNLLFIKELALRAVYDMMHHHITRKEAMQPIEKKIRTLLSSVQNGIYIRGYQGNADAGGRPPLCRPLVQRGPRHSGPD